MLPPLVGEGYLSLDVHQSGGVKAASQRSGKYLRRPAPFLLVLREFSLVLLLWNCVEAVHRGDGGVGGAASSDPASYPAFACPPTAATW